jgi:hypothetical protein
MKGLPPLYRRVDEAHEQWQAGVLLHRRPGRNMKALLEKPLELSKTGSIGKVSLVQEYFTKNFVRQRSSARLGCAGTKYDDDFTHSSSG